MKLRNVVLFAAIFGLSLVGNVFADEPTAPAAQATADVKDTVVKETKEVKKAVYKKDKKVEEKAKDEVKTEVSPTEAPVNK